jgi:hypothetical protein
LSCFGCGEGAEGYGGGILSGAIETVTVTNSTFSGNSATVGGGIDNEAGSVSLEGTIVAGSTSGSDCGGIITDGGYNIDDGSCGFKASNNSVSDYTGPILSGAGLANNGGPTETIALDTSNTSNPAIDAIPTDSSIGCPATDQRGYTRPDEGEPACDMGAYESGATPSTPLTFSTTKLELEPSTGSFDLYSGFTPAAGSTIDPLTQPVTLQIGQIGGYSVTIPAGSFLLRGSKDAYVFEGVIGGVSLQVRILPTGDGSYTLQAEGSNADLSGITNPVTVTLIIGGSSGSTSVTAQFD